MVFTAWVVTVLLVVIPPWWIALALSSSRERAMDRVRRWARRVFAWCGCSLQITGLHNLQPERGAIIVANHSSYLNSVVLLLATASLVNCMRAVGRASRWAPLTRDADFTEWRRGQRSGPTAWRLLPMSQELFRNLTGSPTA